MTTTPTLRDAAQALLKRWDAWNNWRDMYAAHEDFEALRAALAAPADALAEPVAWLWKFPDGEEEVVFVSPERLKAGVLDADEMPSSITPLFTAPTATQLQQAVARALAEQREQIAQGWDGCMCDAVGETLDVGAEIRRGGQQ